MPPVKSNLIKIRVDPNEQRELDEAAAREGLPVSTWLRSLGLREARRKKKDRR